MKIKKTILLFIFLITIFLINLSLITGANFQNSFNEIIENKKIILSQKTVLITGFESWKTYTPNPSQLIAENLSEIHIDGAEIFIVIVPVIWDESVDFVIQSIKFYNPDIIISIGAGIIDSIHVERIGINIKSCAQSDNNGNIILFRLISKNSSFFRFSTLPINKIIKSIYSENIKVEASYNAGTFICNEVMYGTLDYIKKNNLQIKSGFIHVPLLKTQDIENGMEIDEMIKALEIAISVCIEEY